MSVAAPEQRTQPAAPDLRLLVELPSRPRVFFENVRDSIFPPRFATLELQSSPGEFWPDVFVHRPAAWGRFLQSCVYHMIALAVLIAATRFFSLQPRVVAKPAFDRSQIVYSQPSTYLPPLDTRTESSEVPQKADPEFARQAIISVPPEADNREQTIVAVPKVKLNQHVNLPNIIAWSDVEKPKLEIPAAPLIPAAEVGRIAPSLPTTAVAPPPDVANTEPRRKLPALETSAVAPPPDVTRTGSGRFEGLQAPLIAPPPMVESSAARPVGDLDIARSAVIAPAPQLPVAAQRTASVGRGLTAGMMPQVVAPPPSASGSAVAGSSAGARGRMIALNLHPEIGAPPEPAAGNRRGTFAATPEGHAGATGNPGTAAGKEAGAGGSGTAKTKSDLPSGLYVGNATSSSAVAGDRAAAGQNSVNPNLLASARPPRVSTSSGAQPGNAAKLSEAERAVFAGRKFYSLSLNMPNLNSAGGSWIIRFAELNHACVPDPAAPNDLSAPHATRKVDPAYPIQLMRENVAGTVIVYAVIHADGTIGNVRVLQGADERLDRFATDAVAQWKFDPATKNGAPVDVEATFQIPFRPSKMGSSY